MLPDLSEAALRLVHDLHCSQPLVSAEPDCDRTICDAVCSLLELQLAPMGDATPSVQEIESAAECALDEYYTSFAPPRQHTGSSETPETNTDSIRERLQCLAAVPQPEQRTDEWYAFRKLYLTASSAWKAFGTEASFNQLVYDKCKPVSGYTKGGGGVNVESPLHWGQKYEPVSVMWYERQFKTKVGEFGCIPHPTLKCLAASPDGINIDEQNPRYGRMLEIKNVVSREITGIPKKEYWIQMQLQMAVCGLPECDFLETKFVEYDDVAAAEADGDWHAAQDGSPKGRILQFMVDGTPAYEYQPLGASEQQAREWEDEVRARRMGDSWIQDIHWKLEVVSCVLVDFNPRWMRAAEERLKSTWAIIERERSGGYELRAPKRRRASVECAPARTHAPVCLLKIGEDDSCAPVEGAKPPEWSADCLPTKRVRVETVTLASFASNAVGSR